MILTADVLVNDEDGGGEGLTDFGGDGTTGFGAVATGVARTIWLQLVTRPSFGGRLFGPLLANGGLKEVMEAAVVKRFGAGISSRGLTEVGTGEVENNEGIIFGCVVVALFEGAGTSLTGLDSSSDRKMNSSMGLFSSNSCTRQGRRWFGDGDFEGVPALLLLVTPRGVQVELPGARVASSRAEMSVRPSRLDLGKDN